MTFDDSTGELSPRISIVTPSYNQSAYLERTIQSVISQQYPNLEYIIIDGGSTDGSVEIIQQYARSLTRWEKQQGQGHGRAINQGFALATGEIMGWLNADDVYLPHALHIVGQIFADHPHVHWLTSGSVNMSSDDHLFTVQPSRKAFRWWMQVAYRSPPPQHCTFWRRSLWDHAGGSVDEENRYMDCDLWLRFYRYEPLYVADTIFGAWRIHARSFSGQRLRELHRSLDVAHQRGLRECLRQQPLWRMAWPLIAAYLRHVDRGLLSRALFEVHTRRRYFFTYSLRTERFAVNQATGLVPRAWPLTIELPEREPVAEKQV